MDERRLGVLSGLGAYALWGLFPLYFPLLEPATGLEIVAHRVLWSLLFVGLLLTVVRRWSHVRAAVAHRRTVVVLAGAAVLIATNWLIFVYGVNSGHVVETSLGYFINPLVSVVLGVVGFSERLRPLQWSAVGIAAVAVAVLTVDYGRPPWIALSLAFSFGLYGLMKKLVRVEAAPGLFVETSLGYFINPLVSVVLGVVAFSERLRRLQWTAVGIAAVAVVVLTVDYGRPPWIALSLALTFGLYGLMKKLVNVEAAPGLFVETALVALPAAAALAVLHGSGAGTFGHAGPAHALLLASSGAATAIPLLLFAAAARRIPLSIVGLLQYLTPLMQLAIGVFVYDEPMPSARLAGFAIVWLALGVLTVDMLRHARAQSRRVDLATLPVGL